MAEEKAKQLETAAMSLAKQAFQAFCDEIATNYDIETGCFPEEPRRYTFAALKESLGELVGVHIVKSEGLLKGNFYLILDKPGLFVLPGVVMMLPEGQIAHLCETGRPENAEEMAVAVREAGNAIVACWDKTFRAGMQEPGGFIRQDTLISEGWAGVEKNIGISGEQDVLCMMCSFVVGSNVPFRCAAVLPDSLFPQPSAPDAGPQDTAGDAQIPEGASAAGQEPDKAPKDNPETTLLPQARPGRPCAATVMEKRVLWVSESDTVGSVLKQMAATASTYALVGSDGKADGIVSSHDLAAAISPYLKPMLSQWRRPQDEATLDIKIRWVMSKPVETVAPDTPVEWLAGRMVKTGIGCLPVAGTDGKIEGIVTRNDLLSLLEKGDVEQDGITAPAAYSHTN